VISTSKNQPHVPLALSAAQKNGRANAPDADSILLALAAQFETIVAELAAAQRTAIQDGMPAGADTYVRMKLVEAVLTRLDPIEQAIMATPARTIAGLGVKARHAAYVMSRCWEEPIDHRLGSPDSPSADRSHLRPRPHAVAFSEQEG
jgi:hypothetical protein